MRIEVTGAPSGVSLASGDIKMSTTGNPDAVQEGFDLRGSPKYLHDIDSKIVGQTPLW